MWPSTYAFLAKGAPDWLRSELAGWGHPAALLVPGIPASDAPLDPVLALRELITSELLVRALWRELAEAGRVTLRYDLVWAMQGDDLDRFHPVADGLTLLELDTAADFLIARSGCEVDQHPRAHEWVSVSYTLNGERALYIGGAQFEVGAVFDSEPEEMDADLFGLMGLGFAASLAWVEGSSLDLRLTGEGWRAVRQRLCPHLADDADRNEFDTEITVAESALPWIGYADTSDEQKIRLASVIMAARSNPLVRAWGLSDHFLMCLGLHPATPTAVRDQLLTDQVEAVRVAAGLSGD